METLKHTALYDLHLESGARMVAFAGYDMPVQYRHGIKHEHQHTRTEAGLFDISHMGQIRVYGEQASHLLEGLVPGDIENLPLQRQRYTVMTNDAGGIIDDIMVTRAADHLFLVVNAACKEKDFEYLTERLTPACRVELLAQQSLLSLQGPGAARVLGRYVPAVKRLGFMQAGEFKVEGISCFINRCGYTGEDGFEISVPATDTEILTRTLLTDGAVEMIGLGARDTLRLEAGLCLYGHDIDEQTTPVEAGIAWVVAKKYRDANIITARFPGAEKILAQLRDGSERVRIGIRPEGKVMIREGTRLENESGETTGRITSGGYGQTVGGPIAMGYVQHEYAVSGTGLYAMIRERRCPVHVTPLPFVAHRYYKT